MKSKPISPKLPKQLLERKGGYFLSYACYFVVALLYFRVAIEMEMTDTYSPILAENKLSYTAADDSTNHDSVELLDNELYGS